MPFEVTWQGIQVGHIKKFDSRLAIEMLRAYMPAKFKTPGSGQPLVQGDGNQVLIVDAAVRDKLVAMRQERLEAMAEKWAKAIEVANTR